MPSGALHYRRNILKKQQSLDNCFYIRSLNPIIQQFIKVSQNWDTTVHVERTGFYFKRARIWKWLSYYAGLQWLSAPILIICSQFLKRARMSWTGIDLDGRKRYDHFHGFSSILFIEIFSCSDLYIADILTICFFTTLSVTSGLLTNNHVLHARASGKGF